MNRQETDGQTEHGETGIILLCHQHPPLALRIKRGSQRALKMVNTSEPPVSGGAVVEQFVRRRLFFYCVLRTSIAEPFFNL